MKTLKDLDEKGLELNNIYCCDCLEGLKRLQDNSVDLVVTDPPYNVSQNEKELIRETLKSPMFCRKTSIKLDFGNWDKMEEKEFLLFTEMWFKEVSRILKPAGWCFIFFSKERIGYFTDPISGLFFNNGFKTRTIITWHKTNPTPSFTKMNFLSSCEFCVVGSKGIGRVPNFLQQSQMHNFYETSNKSSYAESMHPTEKPKDLLNWLLKLGSNKNDTVLDAFMGSGTTAVACKDLERNYIGFEISEEYCQIAEERLKKVNNKKLSEWFAK